MTRLVRPSLASARALPTVRMSRLRRRFWSEEAVGRNAETYTGSAVDHFMLDFAARCLRPLLRGPVAAASGCRSPNSESAISRT